MTSDLPPGWTAATVGDIARVVGGGTPKTSVDAYWGDEVPWLTPKDLRDFDARYVHCGERSLTQRGLDESSARLLPQGTVLVSSRAPIGYVAIAADRIATNQGFKNLVLKDGYLPEFYYYVMKTKKAEMEAVAGGSTFKEISGKVMKTIPVPVPPIEEQRAIAEVLGALDDRIAQWSDAKDVLHDLGSTALDQWLRSHGLSSSRPLEAERRVPLGDVVSVLESGSRPRGGVKGIDEGVPSVGAESITRIGDFDYAKTKFVPRSFFESMRRGRVEDFDVLVYKDGGKPGTFIPHVSMAGGGHPFPSFVINDHVYRVRVRPPYGQAFLYFWLSTSQSTEEMARRGTGAAQPGLNQTNFKQVPVPKANAEALLDVEQRLMPVAELILHYAKEQQVLAQLRDALLPRLLAGTLRIEDPERLLGTAA